MESEPGTLTQQGFRQAEVRKVAVQHCIINDSFSGLLLAPPSPSTLRSRTWKKSVTIQKQLWCCSQFGCSGGSVLVFSNTVIPGVLTSTSFSFSLKGELEGEKFSDISWSIYKAKELAQNGAKMHFTASAVLLGRALYIEMMALFKLSTVSHWRREGERGNSFPRHPNNLWKAVIQA